jgi:flavodoxin I
VSIAIYYGSSTGNTREVAQKIADKLGADIYDLGSDDFSGIGQYDAVIFGTSTWGEGDLQDDWEENWESFENLDLSGKTVALFGLGDQDSYEDYFVDAMGTIYEQVLKNGAKKVVGFTSTSGYDFSESKAAIEESFVGLVIDEDNQSELSDERIAAWCESIAQSI